MTTKPAEELLPSAEPEKEVASAKRAKVMANLALRPTVNAGVIVEAFTWDPTSEVSALDAAEELCRQCEALEGGSLSRVEAILMSQAHSLDVMFAGLALRSSSQRGLKQYEAFMKLALRAQSQCRATLEVLAAIKSPPLVFAKQANIAHGPQQVNNGVEAPPSRAEQIEIRPNELLEHDHGERMDTRATGEASGSDQTMATVEVINRP